MLTVSDNVIRITKGDSATLTVTLTNEDGTAYTMAAGDSLTMTIRQSPDSHVLATITSTTTTLSLPSSVTKGLIVGECCYDIELSTAAGNIYTVIGLTDINERNLIVYPEVTVTS